MNEYNQANDTFDWKNPEARSDRVLAFPHGQAAIVPAQTELSPIQRKTLTQLRRLAIKSRLCPGGGASTARRMIACSGRDGGCKCAKALFRAISGATRAPLSFFPAGAESASADEHWLLRLLDRIVMKDHAGARALIGFRVAPDNRRMALAMCMALASELEGLVGDDFSSL